VNRLESRVAPHLLGLGVSVSDYCEFLRVKRTNKKQPKRKKTNERFSLQSDITVGKVNWRTDHA